MDKEGCSTCSLGGDSRLGEPRLVVPLSVLAQHPHLSKPLNPLVVQVETDVRSDAAGRVTQRSHNPKKEIRPLYTAVRRMADGWIGFLTDSWPYGPARVYVELCDHVCLVADSRGMPTADREREADFDPSHNAPSRATEPTAWACLRAATGRERNQRPRTVGPVQEDVRLGPEDVVNWRHLVEILGLPLEPHLKGVHFSCLDVTQRIENRLSDSLKSELRAYAARLPA